MRKMFSGRQRSMLRLACLYLLISTLAVPWLMAEAVHVSATDSAVSYVGRWGAIELPGQTAMATINSSCQIYLTSPANTSPASSIWVASTTWRKST